MERAGQLLAAALASLFVAASAHARLVPSVVLDEDIPGCDAAVIGTVLQVESRKEKLSEPGFTSRGKPVEEEAELGEVSFRAERVIKGGPGEPRTCEFRYSKFAEPSIWRLSRYWFDCERGRTYLFFLRKAKDGGYELAAPYWPAVEFGPETVQKLKPLRQRGEAAERAVELLLTKLESESTGLAEAIWLLEGSRCFERELERLRFRRRVVEALVRVTEDSRDGEDALAAYRLLGRLNETCVIPRIVEFVCRKEWTWEPKTAAVHWLEGFPARRQVRALEQIAVLARDPNAARYAFWRLKHVKRLAEFEEAAGAISEKLFRRVRLEFVETSLDEAAAFIEGILGLNVRVRPYSSEVVTLRIHDMPLADAVWRLCWGVADVGLTQDGLVLGSRIREETVERFEALLPLRRDWEQWLMDAFARGVSFEFVETPVSEAVSYLQTMTKMNMILEPIATTIEVPLTWRAFDLPLGEALWWCAYHLNAEIGFHRGWLEVGRHVPFGGGMARFESLLPSARAPGADFRKAEAALSRRIDLCADVPISDVVSSIQALVPVNVLLDPSVRRDDRPTPTLNLDRPDVRDIILGVARAAGLDAGFVHGVVFISTPEELKRLGARSLNP